MPDTRYYSTASGYLNALRTDAERWTGNDFYTLHGQSYRMVYLTPANNGRA